MEADDFTKEVPLHDAIMYLKDNLKEKEWRDVGRYLGVSESDIDHINSEHVGIKEKCYQMLKKWEEVRGSEATVSILTGALKKSRRNDLSDLLITGKLPITLPKKGDEFSSVAERDKNRDVKRWKIYKILEPIMWYFWWLQETVLIVWLVKTNMEINALYSSQHENNTCSSARPTTVQSMIDGTLAFMDGVGRIEAKWQKFSAGTGRHSLTMGKPDAGDTLLYEEKIRKGYCCYILPIFRQRHTFRYVCNEREFITSVIVEDGWDDGTGGNPEIIAGGPRDCHVEIMVTSRIGRGMDFSFYVFGRKDKNKVYESQTEDEYSRSGLTSEK